MRLASDGVLTVGVFHLITSARFAPPASDGVLTAGVFHPTQGRARILPSSDGVLTAVYFTNHFADASKMVFGRNAEGGNIFSYSWKAFILWCKKLPVVWCIECWQT